MKFIQDLEMFTVKFFPPKMQASMFLVVWKKGIQLVLHKTQQYLKLWFFGVLCYLDVYTCIDLLTDSQEMYTSFDVVNFDVLEFQKRKKQLIHTSFSFLLLINLSFFLVTAGSFVALTLMNKAPEKVTKPIPVDVSFNKKTKKKQM